MKLHKYFLNFSCSVSGYRRSGKDLLFAHVCKKIGRRVPIFANVRMPNATKVAFSEFVQPNTFDDFIFGKLKHFKKPYPKAMYFFSDAALFFPSSHHKELDKRYPSVPPTLMLWGQMYGYEFHYNTQVDDWFWDKARKHSEIWIITDKMRFFKIFGFGWASVYVYDRQETALKRVKPLHLSHWDKQYKVEREHFNQLYGTVEKHTYFFTKKLLNSFDSTELADKFTSNPDTDKPLNRNEKRLLKKSGRAEVQKTPINTDLPLVANTETQTSSAPARETSQE